MEKSGLYDHLICAIKEGKTEKVKSLINSFPIPQEEQFNSLCLAVFHNNVDIVKLLLSHEFAYFDKSTNECPALKMASHNDNIEIIELLLERGMKTNYMLCKSIMYLATVKGNERVLRLLDVGIDVDIDVDLKVRGPFSCIHIAVENGHSGVTKFLLKCGANVNVRCPVKDDLKVGSTLLHRAVESGNFEIVELLLKYGASVNAKSSIGLTALHIASEKGFVRIAKWLIKKGAKIDAVTASVVPRSHKNYKFVEDQTRQHFLGINRLETSFSFYKGAYTPLHIAVKRSQESTVKLLLEHGANVDAQSISGDTSLLLAIKSENSIIVEDILRYHPSKENQSNAKALHLAAKHRGEEYTRMIACLLSNGFSCCPERLIDYDLLLEAARNNHTQIVDRILNCVASFKAEEIMNARLYLSRGHGNNFLQKAVESGCKDVVRFLIDYEVDINTCSESGRFPLSYAVENSNLEVARLLLQNGAEVCKDKKVLRNAAEVGCLDMVQLLINYGAVDNQDNALFIAAKKGFVEIVKTLLRHRNPQNDIRHNIKALRVSILKGNFEVVELLLKHGISPNYYDGFGKTFLYYAAMSGHESILKLLLRHGAKVDGTRKKFDENPVNPLLAATVNGHTQIVKILLKFGAKLDVEDSRGKSPLFIAAELGHDDMLKLFLKYVVEVDHKNNKGHTPLFCTVSRGHLKTVELLLNHGAAANFVGEDGTTSLHIAASKGSNDLVKFLLQHGAEVNCKNNQGETPLYLAAEKGHEESVKTLLSFSASIDSFALPGKAPLEIAIKKGHHEVVTLLLAAGAKLDPQTGDVVKSFFRFIEEGHTKMVQVLLKLGINVRLLNSVGKSTLRLAFENNRVEIAKLLMQHGLKIEQDYLNQDGKTPLLISAQKGHLKIVKALIKRRVCLNSTDNCGRTALYLAAEYNKIEMVKLLLNSGFSLDAKDENGKTPLIIAAERGNFQIVLMLLEAGADIDSSDDLGFTTLHYIAEYGVVNILRSVLENEAEVDSKTENGKTPLFMSVERGRHQATELLLKFGANPNFIDSDGSTPLHYAVKYGHHDIVLSLLMNGAQLNCRALDGVPLVLLAAQMAYPSIVWVLLEFGAKIDLTNPSQAAFVSASLNSWKPQILKIILEFDFQDDKALSESNARLFLDILSRTFVDQRNPSAVKRVLVEHRLKLEVTNPDSSDETGWLSHQDEEVSFCRDCFAEKKQMSEQLIENTQISFYDILLKDLNEMASVLRHPSMDAFISEFCLDQFPIFGTLFAEQFVRGIRRMIFIDRGVEILSFLFRSFPPFPFDILENVAAYLSNKDLIVLFTAVRSREDVSLAFMQFSLR